MQLNNEGGGWRDGMRGKMRDDNTYTGDGEDLDLVTLETETERQGDSYRKQRRESSAAAVAAAQRSPQGRTEGHGTENQLAAEQTEPLSEQIQLG